MSVRGGNGNHPGQYSSEHCDFSVLRDAKEFEVFVNRPYQSSEPLIILSDAAPRHLHERLSYTSNTRLLEIKQSTQRPESLLLVSVTPAALKKQAQIGALLLESSNKPVCSRRLKKRGAKPFMVPEWSQVLDNLSSGASFSTSNLHFCQRSELTGCFTADACLGCRSEHVISPCTQSRARLRCPNLVFFSRAVCSPGWLSSREGRQPKSSKKCHT